MCALLQFTRRLAAPRSTAILAVLLLAAAIALAACGGDEPSPPFDPEIDQPVTLIVTSRDFDAGGEIPVELTCDGADRSPRIEWSVPPSGARAVTIVMDDPDAPGRIFTHWLYYDIPVGTSSLNEDIQPGERPAPGGLQGKNDFGEIGYRGPCPPPGLPHEYRIFVYATNEPLSLDPGASQSDVARALRGKVIGVGEITGFYGR